MRIPNSKKFYFTDIKKFYLKSLLYYCLGINSSLIRSLYEPPIDTIASSKKNSRQGITIRRNKRSMNTDESSSSYLNRTESSHSSNLRPAPNMIPCFPANNNTDAHPCGIASNRSSTLHITEHSPPNTSQIRTRSTTKKLNHTAWKIKRILFEK